MQVRVRWSAPASTVCYAVVQFYCFYYVLLLGGYVMNTIDLTPLYRNSIGFDRLASLLDSALRTDSVAPGYPPYNIEMLGENRYAITLAVAGFEQSELELTVEKGVLTVRGKKAKEEERKYLHQGIANRAFERKFNLADYVEVTGADLQNGLLTISLVKEIPEAMKPRTIAINQTRDTSVIEHRRENEEDQAA
jgi:molecular chaperone IbpA